MNSHVPIAYLRQLPNFAVLFHLQKLSPVFFPGVFKRDLRNYII